MRVGALGPVEVLGTDVPVNLGGPKPKALLAALLLEPRHVVSVERLVDLIWDERPPSSAVALVHTYVSLLRRGFATVGAQSALVTRAPGYLLDVDPANVDLVLFTRYRDDARQAEQELDFNAAAEHHRQALALWRGPAFGGVDARFARSRAGALEDERLAAEEGLARCELALGQVRAAVSRLTLLTAAHPLREEGRGLLMRALYLSGRQGDALAAYRAGREQLIAELGVEPGPTLRELHARILDGTLAAPAAQQPATQLATLPAPRPPEVTAPNLLPPDVADFTGRDEAVAHIRAYARSATHPVIVVSGVGGAGKSALAVHCAHLLAAGYPDGVLFADLHGAGKPVESADVLARFLRALGVAGADLPDDPDERAELYRMTVAGRHVIIVLDNVRSEQQVRPLLPGSGSCLVIVTSRSRLTGLAGAEPIELDILSATASLDMLGRIVGAARTGAEPEAAATIARLCAGVPLAIRVAGAKLLARAHWPLRTLAARLSDERRRLDELAVGDLAIRSSLELNYAELAGSHRRAFHLLSLLGLPDFGAWLAAPLLDVDLDEAEDVVEHLVDLRLLDIAGIDAIGRVRYRFHDLVQLFGAEQAARHEPEDVVRAALCRALAVLRALVETGAARLPRVTLGLRPAPAPTVELDPRLAAEVSDDPTGWLKSETQTVVRALERAHELGADEASTTLITSLLSSPFAARNEFDGWQRSHEVALRAAVSSGDRHAEATVLAGLGQLFYERDEFATALAHFRNALRLAADIGADPVRAVALVGIGTVQRDLAEFTEARACLEAAAELAGRTGDRGVLAAARYGFGAIHRDHGDLTAATAALEECVALYRDLDDRRGEALALRGLSLCRRAAGDAEAAAALSEQALKILEEAGDTLGAAYALQSLAKARIRQGRLDAVPELLARARETCTTHRDRFGTALITRTQGELALAAGDTTGAATLLTDALGQWRDLRLPLWEARTLRDLAAAVNSPDHWTRALGIFTATQAREHTELAPHTPETWRAHVHHPDL
ncbi:MAG TPA: BTAD domain-containing putative transcriptional regulator [Actinophytocola sp.]|jgi:DNA-binding SARP family transcriptional activator/tetratricopeptide (TPR) repeat protein|uniref:AfsR/SARP family transcriptional regulator n=1 Tax=Actinophytocola sp. TaxID=1872138 RepID=UPI002E0AAF79|nr:BTAD domain-containing putative transcriptional regulator [Actinophytocola sp.]